MGWFARGLRPRLEDIARPIATDDAYFDCEAAAAQGAWNYYRRFLKNLPGPLRILDVGCGPAGRTVSYAQVCEESFYCLDSSIDLLKAGARRSGRIVPISGDADRLPFLDATFDACLCENTLEHLAHPEQAVRQMERVVRPGGLLLMLFPPWRGAYSGHLTRSTWLPWIHLLPAPVLISLLAALETGQQNDPSHAGERALKAANNLVRHLNGWTLGELLAVFADCKSLDLVDAYVLGEWRVGRVLRFVPWLGELFSSAIYLVFRKVETEGRRPRTFNDLLKRTLRSRDR